MGTARKFLELSADFLIFVAACFFILNGMSQVSAMQEALHRGLSDKGMNQVVDYPVSYSSGESLIALLCYPEGIDRIILNDTAYEGNLHRCMGYIMSTSDYQVERIIAEDGTVSLSINEVMP